jgi:hypothetical protein
VLHKFRWCFNRLYRDKKVVGVFVRFSCYGHLCGTFALNDCVVNSLLLPRSMRLRRGLLEYPCGVWSGVPRRGGFMAQWGRIAVTSLPELDIWWGGELLYRCPEVHRFSVMGGVMTLVEVFGLRLADQGFCCYRGDTGSAVRCLAV